MKQALDLRLGQQLAMTPRMHQAIRLLQLSTLDLRGELRQILESNYMLEMDDEVPSEEWGSGPVREHDRRGTDSLPEPEESLRDRLFWQLNHARLSDEDYLIGTVIIDAIDERGYLECSMDELLESLARLGLPAEAEEVEAVLKRVQRFEPPGVGARSLSECLLRQLEEGAADVPHRDLAMRIARNHLEALARRDIASELDLHESTVSRVTSGKYVQTPRGVFELKYFFSNQVSTVDGGSASATAIRARLRKIIEREEPGRPCSDRRLASDLERAGFRVARRTVAKYRESMGIPPSNERRRARAVNLNVSA